MHFLRFIMVAACAAPLFAGGMWFSLCDPLTVSGDPLAQGAFAALRISVFDGTSVVNARITGTAEGLVDNQRVSMSLKITQLSSSGLYGIWWNQPKAGAWVLTIKAWEWALDPKGPRFTEPSGHGVGPEAFTIGRKGVKNWTVKPMLSNPLRPPQDDLALTLQTMTEAR